LPDLPALGFAAESRWEFYTEFEEDAPLRALLPTVIQSERDPARRARMAVPDITDHFISAGGMAMPRGKAFVGAARTRGLAPALDGAPVGKSVVMGTDGRKFLVETLDHRDIVRLLEAQKAQGKGHASATKLKGGLASASAAGMNRLPAAPAFSAGVPLAPGRPVVASSILPARPPRQLAAAPGRILKAASYDGSRRNDTARTEDGAAPLLVWDYEVLSGDSNPFRLSGSQTYLISGLAIYWSDLEVCAGTVVKHDGDDSSTYLLAWDTVTCSTAPFR
jgi:hypothetical protein